jgi:DNA (cytosine-5)-methyltransferase 1
MRGVLSVRAVDLFAGCGGMSKGFQNAGINIVAAFEFWSVAANCYRNNFKHPVFESDLSNTEVAIEKIKEYKPELIIGGPPCQDFSHAGKRIEAGRASLTGSFADIIKAIQPSYFVMENVDRAQKSNAYSYARQTFKDSGYGLTEIVLDASRCGVPQKRKRFFCLGALGKPDDFARRFVESGISEKETTLRDYFGETLDFEFYYRHPRNYSRRAIFSIDEPAPTMRGVNRPVPKGYPGHANDACPLNENVRSLTNLERALVQTFPSDFKWSGNKTEMEQMIGNAVPVKLAEFVANALLSFINASAKMESQKEAFVNWLITDKHFSNRSASDTVSRMKRAEKICPLNGIPDSYYIFSLEQKSDFQSLSVGVKSQIKRATTLYADYLSAVR